MHVIMYAIMYVIILYDGVGGCHGQLVTVDGSGTTIGDVLEGLSVSSRAMMLLESGVVHVVPVEEYPRIVELSVVGTVSDDAEVVVDVAGTLPEAASHVRVRSLTLVVSGGYVGDGPSSEGAGVGSGPVIVSPSGGDVTLTDVIVRGQRSVHGGGALVRSVGGGVVTMTNIASDAYLHGDYGALLYAEEGVVLVEELVVSHVSASVSGGALYVEGASVQVTNVNASYGAARFGSFGAFFACTGTLNAVELSELTASEGVYVSEDTSGTDECGVGSACSVYDENVAVCQDGGGGCGCGNVLTCVTSCALGEELVGECSDGMSPMCVACDDTMLPSGGVYVSAGKCTWRCPEGSGYDVDGDACVSCLTSSACVGGEYLSGVCGLNGVGACVGCENGLPVGGEYVDGGVSCAWKCPSGYGFDGSVGSDGACVACASVSDCVGGEYLGGGVCGEGGVSECVACEETLPMYAEYVAGGESCRWACESGRWYDASVGGCVECVTRCEGGERLEGVCGGDAGPVCVGCESVVPVGGGHYYWEGGVEECVWRCEGGYRYDGGTGMCVECVRRCEGGMYVRGECGNSTGTFCSACENELPAGGEDASWVVGGSVSGDGECEWACDGGYGYNSGYENGDGSMGRCEACVGEGECVGGTFFSGACEDNMLSWCAACGFTLDGYGAAVWGAECEWECEAGSWYDGSVMRSDGSGVSGVCVGCVEEGSCGVGEELVGACTNTTSGMCVGCVGVTLPTNGAFLGSGTCEWACLDGHGYNDMSGDCEVCATAESCAGGEGLSGICSNASVSMCVPCGVTLPTNGAFLEGTCEWACLDGHGYNDMSGDCDGAFLEGTCEWACLDGHGYNDMSGDCEVCATAASCGNGMEVVGVCGNETVSMCASCGVTVPTNGAFLEGSCEWACLDGHGYNDMSGDCEVCATAESCGNGMEVVGVCGNETVSTCASCGVALPGGASFIVGTCEWTCDGGNEYVDESGVCVSCASGCSGDEGVVNDCGDLVGPICALCDAPENAVAVQVEGMCAGFLCEDGYTRDYEADECVVCQAFCGPGEYVSGHCTASLDTTECSHCPEHTYEEGGVCVPCLATPETCTGDLVSTCGVASQSDVSLCICSASYCADDSGRCAPCEHAQIASHHPIVGIVSSVSVNNMFIAVGYDDYLSEGVVYVYKLGEDGSWSHIVTLHHPGGSGHTAYGRAVQFVEDNRLVVGAPFASEHASESGAIFTYEWNEAGFTFDRLPTADHSGFSSHDGFGHSLAADGRRLVVGRPYGDSAHTNQGLISVFHYSEGQWVHEATLQAATTDTSYQFGWDVDISGDYVICGVRHDDATVEVWEYSSGLWFRAMLFSRPSSVPHSWGYAVAIDGSVLAISGLGYNNQQGSVYTFSRSASGWGSSYFLIADDAVGAFSFGRSLIMQDGVLYVGSTSRINLNGNQAGAVYVYDPSASGGWIQRPLAIVREHGTLGQRCCCSREGGCCGHYARRYGVVRV